MVKSSALALAALPALAAASPLQTWQYSKLLPRQAAPNETVTLPNNVSEPWSWTSGPKLLGMNLGNHLLREYWMAPAAWNATCGPSAEDEWTCMEKLGQERGLEVYREHWDTWITDEDIDIIGASGFNHVRIPVPYWAFIQGPPNTPYLKQAGQVQVLDRLVEAAARNNLRVILDLHALPGSQNGAQPSGQIGEIRWYTAANQQYSDEAIDAILGYIGNSTHRNLFSGFEPVNEPIFYSEADFRSLRAFYERTYAKMAAMDPPLPMMFSPGKPQTDPYELWQSFMNGKNPELLIFNEHPYIGRLAPRQSQDSYIQETCSRAKQYASFSIPAVTTEWSLSTAITDDAEWNRRFWAANIRAWAQTAGSLFWSYRVDAEPDAVENLHLYSYQWLRQNNMIPLPEEGDDDQDYIFSQPDVCGVASSSNKIYSSVINYPSPTVMNAFTRRSLALATHAPS